ncbi:hypothetical protein ACFRQM_40040 [Streptomyces sp. NPDC056831]|uniref:hypothetical protein n=1 Tax=Streptomyces sp. NPDC056831 TaxID=3345954 RepID=UPI003680A2A8
MILGAFLDKVSVWRDRREVQSRRLQAAENFVWTWADRVDPDNYEFGAVLNCTEANTLAELFRVFHFWNTANQLVREHGSNCNGAEQHPEDIVVDMSDRTHTFDGIEITSGLRVFNYYDRKWGVVAPAQFERTGDLSPGGELFDGWYDVRHDDGSTALLNGHRISTFDPNSGPETTCGPLKF